MLCVTNTNQSTATTAHYQYVNVNANPADPFFPNGCTVFNRREHLTPADTLCVLTSCHNAAAPGGQEGYVVITAEDPELFAVAWGFDYLIGSELVINSSGIMYAVNAMPIEARVPEGEPTDLDMDSNLDLNDFEYEPISDQMYIDSFVPIQACQLALINLTGTSQAINTVQFSIWNDNEFPLSTSLRFKCWFDQPLEEISIAFSQDFLRHSTPHDPEELAIGCEDGAPTVETGWAIVDSVDVSTTGGLVVAFDGALVGAITCGNPTRWDGGHLLWESVEKQRNGKVFAP